MRQKRDPLEHVKSLLSEFGHDMSEVKNLEKAIKKEIDSSVEAAKAEAPSPDEWLWRNVYRDSSGVQLRGIAGEMHAPVYDPEYKL